MAHSPLNTAYASNSAITLIFEDTLKSADTSSFTNQINGYDVTIKSRAIKGKIITLLLPPNTLQAGDKVEVAWRNLPFQNGKKLNGNTSVIAE